MEDEHAQLEGEDGTSFELRAISEITEVLHRLMRLQEVTLELVKITGERIEAVERWQQGLSFEDMVDGKVPPQGLTADQIDRLKTLQQALAEDLPDLPRGI